MANVGLPDPVATLVRRGSVARLAPAARGADGAEPGPGIARDPVGVQGKYPAAAPPGRTSCRRPIRPRTRRSWQRPLGDDRLHDEEQRGAPRDRDGAQAPVQVHGKAMVAGVRGRVGSRAASRPVRRAAVARHDAKHALDLLSYR